MRNSHDHVKWRTMMLEMLTASAAAVLIYIVVRVHSTQTDLTFEQQAM
jgi:hypothetical protein